MTKKKDFITEDSTIEMKKDPKTRTTIRNLRIREDTAGYLKDIRSNSDDPKTNEKDDGSEFVRATDEFTKFTEVQRYAWNAYERGQEIHLSAAPSQAELAFREYKGKKEVLTQEQKEAILSKYGGREHLEPPKELLVAQTDTFVTYNLDGTIARGQEKLIVPRSKYDEDVFLNNHTSVWGSYWENGQWGYACCRQSVKNSYCIGKTGIEIQQERQQQTETAQEESQQPEKKTKKG